jgi:hypothetical protein
MKRNPIVTITEIKNVKNGAFQLTLEQSYEREGNTGAVVGFFMAGHPGINPGSNKLITWQTVSAEKMAQYNFAVGQDLSKVVGMDCNIQVTESFEPRSWKDAQGNTVSQEAKRAGEGGSVLTKGGKSIYRNTGLVFGAANDTLIQHDNVVVSQSAKTTTAASILGE